MITRPDLIKNICDLANIQRDQESKTEGYFSSTELEKLYTFVSILKQEITKLSSGSTENEKPRT